MTRKNPASITYRDLRNTPGRVWEQLATEGALSLVADGQVQAIMLPVVDGNADAVLEAYQSGRALLAMRRISEYAERTGLSDLTDDDISSMVRDVRHELRGGGEN